MTSDAPQTPVSRILPAEEIALRAGEQVPFLRLPQRESVFAERAVRLRQLAAGHAMRDYLLFVAAIVEQQDARLREPRTLPLPDAARIAAAIDSGRPTLDATTTARPEAWRDDLRAMLAALVEGLGDSPAVPTLQRVARADDDWLEQQADRLIAGRTLGLDLAAAPLVAAGLQLLFTRWVIDTADHHAGARPEPFGRTADPTTCPCCGTRPVASVVRIGTDASGFRYLACGLCSTQWHMVRIKCSRCESTKGITYRTLEPVDGHVPAPTAPPAEAVQAECCGECGHYLKIVHMSKDQHVEPLADDLATLTLDLLVADEGFERNGANLMLLFGDPDAEADAAPGAGGAGS